MDFFIFLVFLARILITISIIKKNWPIIHFFIIFKVLHMGESRLRHRLSFLSGHLRVPGQELQNRHQHDLQYVSLLFLDTHDLTLWYIIYTLFVLFLIVYSMGSHKDVDTSLFRRAVWHYIHSLFGVRYDDYDYKQIRKLLASPLRSYIKILCSFPERITKKDYDSIMKEFTHSEKVNKKPYENNPVF